LRYWALFIVLAGGLACSVVLAYRGQAGDAGVVILGFAVFAIVVNIRQVSYIRLWGLRARLREAIHEADEAVTKANDAYTLVLASSIHSMSFSGRFSSVESRMRSHAYITKLISAIDPESMSDDVKACVDDYMTLIKWDYVVAIKRLARQDSPLYTRLRGLEAFGEQPNPEELRKLARQSDEVEGLTNLISRFELACNAEWPELCG